MTTRHYCTLFDRNYLVKGLTMLRSLAVHSPGARVHVLCMDELTRTLLDRAALPGVTTLPLAEVETPDVLAVKATRSVAEYCWTLAPVLTSHVMHKHADIDMLTYLDADLMFFSPVEPLFDEMGAASIAAIEHRYTPRLAHLEVYGRFNVQWVSFRRSDQGVACLTSWRDQCIEWCFAKVEDGKLGDQKYLDAWPDRFSEFRVLGHVGAGVAPWNYANYRFSEQAGRLQVDDRPLVFYHFHQFQMLEGGGYDYCSSNYTQDGPPPEPVYGAYRKAVQSTLGELQRLHPGFEFGLVPGTKLKMRRMAQRYLPLAIKNAIRNVLERARS
jgi:hypothetical protein